MRSKRSDFEEVIIVIGAVTSIIVGAVRMSRVVGAVGAKEVGVVGASGSVGVGDVVERVGSVDSLLVSEVGVVGAEVEEMVVEKLLILYSVLMHSVLLFFIFEELTLLVHLVIILFIVGLALGAYSIEVIFSLCFIISTHSFERVSISCRDVGQGDPSEVFPLPP